MPETYIVNITLAMIRGLLVFVLITFCAELRAQEVEEVLEKHFQSVGQEMWNQITDVTIDGRWVDKDYRGYSIDLKFKRPAKIRIEGVYNRQKFIEATDGKVAWILAPWKSRYEVQLMNPTEKLRLENSFSLGSPMYSVKDQLTFTGLQDFEGMVYLTYTLETEDLKQTFFIDRDDYRLYVETYELEGKQIVKIYEKYRDYQGLVFPTAVRFEGEDLERELVYDEVFIGVGVRDDVFNLPKGQ